jgi:hypothetical protein
MILWALSWFIKMWGFNFFVWHRWYYGTGLASMVDHSFWKVLPHSSLWVEWVLRWKCTTPLGCKTNRLAVSRLWTNWVSRQGCTKESHHLFIIIKIGLETILERWLLGAIHLAINPGLVWLLSPEGHLGSYSGPHTWLSTHGMWWLSLESYP